jgi:tetratricopeptide (TPR) repeat protein
MGKTRPPERHRLDKRNKKLIADKKRKDKPTQTPEQLLTHAALLLQQSEPENALPIAAAALSQLKSRLEFDEDIIACLPALNLLGEINVELGDIEAAREHFSQAAQIDEDGEIPEDQGGGSEKFLWLAQLSEEGGMDSVWWFEKGAGVLRSDVKALEDDISDQDKQVILEEKRKKLAGALCAIAEVYMTDLSWDDEKAEEQCNIVMEEALAVAPDSPETLQTVASVRISQLKLEEARQYLTKSLALWKDLAPEDLQIPDFPTRISLARLLMEAEMEDEAIEVLERLIQEDDNSVEAWYLGGWCLNLLAEKQKKAANGHANDDSNNLIDLMKRSRRWLLQCLSLCQTLEYEDERLQEHAAEIVASLNKVLGEPDEAETQSAAEDDWDDEDDEDDESSVDEDDEMEE